MASAHRDLRTGTPVWETYRTPAVGTSKLTRDTQCDVLVVGAGISGALTAELLAADGHKVVIVDRRGPFRGSTSANTALLLYEIDIPLSLLIRKIGEEKAVRAWRRSFLALHGLTARTRFLRIPCDLAWRQSIYLAGNVLDRAGLQRESGLRAAAGFHSSYFNRSQMQEEFGIVAKGALLSEGSIEVDPRKLTAGYLRTALQQRALLYAPVDVTSVEGGPRVVHAHTAAGPTIKCRHLVFATGYEVPRGVPMRGHRIVSTYAMATRPQARRLWPGRCFVWEASKPYLYARTTPDGRVLAGGEDEEISDADARDRLLGKKIQRIRTKLGRILPAVDTRPAFQWAGAFGMSATGLPAIGEVPGMKNCWAMLGFGGNGTTYARLGAEIIRTALAGKEDPDTDLYAFTRS
jgi:glycine/D-amino acid oxidase-like deaminating enzyme